MGLEEYKVGIVGASGYTGAELLRLIPNHPNLVLQVASAHSKANTKIADLYPNLAAHYKDTEFSGYDTDKYTGLDLVFICLPHGLSAEVVVDLKDKVKHIIDLGSDFRLKDPELYPTWYNKKHEHPELLTDFEYGLPELFADKLSGANLIAATGCNAATATLGLAPFVSSNTIEQTNIIVDIKTGISGAGRPPKETTTFCTIDENVEPYALLSHRHTPEIEQALTTYSKKETKIVFTPHLVPMSRGILATSYAQATQKTNTTETIEILKEFYRQSPFVVVSQRPPATKSTLGSNTIHITSRHDERTNNIIVIAALDNLMKGASGMAIQNANLALGLPETTGLPTTGQYP